MKKTSAPRLALIVASTIRAILTVACGPFLALQERIARLCGWASLPVTHPIGRRVASNVALPLAMGAFAPALFLLGAKKTAVLVALFAFFVCLALAIVLTFRLAVALTASRN